MMSKETLLIRPAADEDRPAIRKVHSASIREICSEHYTPDQVSAWICGHDPDGRDYPIDDGGFLVAEDGLGIAGFGEVRPEEDGTGEVRAVYVRPDRIRSGVGRALYSALELIARDRGLRELHLDASLSAVAFYEAMGFEVRSEADHLLGSGVTIPCVRMKKCLVRPWRWQR